MGRRHQPLQRDDRVTSRTELERRSRQRLVDEGGSLRSHNRFVMIGEVAEPCATVEITRATAALRFDTDGLSGSVEDSP
jgi:hypothetical protein